MHPQQTRRTSLALALAACLVGGLGACGSAQHSAPVTPAPTTAIQDIHTTPATVAQLRALLFAEAAKRDVPNPSASGWVLVTVAEANGMPASTEADWTPIYVLVAHGAFVDQGAWHPAGTGVPSGSTLTLRVDARSLRLIGTQVDDGAPTTDSLGRLHHM